MGKAHSVLSWNFKRHKNACSNRMEELFTKLNFYFKKLTYSLEKIFIWNAGYRSLYLSHAKRALYHLSYIPSTGLAVAGLLLYSIVSISCLPNPGRPRGRLPLIIFYKRELRILTIGVNQGLIRDLNPGPLAPKARIIPLDH